MIVASIWDPLTAIGTLTMATFTLVLALATIRLALQGGEEVRAEWRPVLVIEPMATEGGFSPSVSYRARELWLSLHNVGRGPGLGITGTLEWGEKDLRLAKPVDAVLAPDGFMALGWSNLDLPNTGTVRLSGWINYGDVSESSYTTFFGLDIDFGALAPFGDAAPSVFQQHRRDPELVPRWIRALPKPLVRLFVRRRLRLPSKH